MCDELEGCSGVFETITKISSVPDWFGWYPAISISAPASINEGATTLKVNVSLDAICDDDVTVTIVSNPISADEGDDYTGFEDDVIIYAGDLYALYEVEIVDDSLDENDEYFEISICNPQYATLGKPENIVKTIKIKDNDEPPVAYVDGTEVEESDGVAYITIGLESVSEKEVKVRYSTGTAISGSDFVPASEVVTFAPYEDEVVVEITLKKDGRDEWNEEFYIKL